MQAVFLGAHPDDIEIGAGGLVQRTLANGYDVFMIVATDEPGQAETRRVEAIEAAAVLGVQEDRVHFLGLEDGNFSSNRQAVSSLRELCRTAQINPDLVVTHSTADSHQDHREVNSLARAAFRGVCVLQFYIYVSGEPNSFRPSLFIRLDDITSSTKNSAISCHSSQTDRLNTHRRHLKELEFGAQAGLARAEAFEILRQSNADIAALDTLNESALHRFFHGLGGSEPWLIVGDAPNASTEFKLYSPENAHAGIDRLRDSMQKLRFERGGYKEISSESVQAMDLTRANNVLLSGGPVSNRVTREIVNHGVGIDWVIDYTFQGDNIDLYACSREHGTKLLAEKDKSGRLKTDIAVLTVCRNPFDPALSVVSCAGIHGTGTQTLLLVLADCVLGDLDDLRVEYERAGLAQAVYRCNARSLEVIDRVDRIDRIDHAAH